MKIITISRQFGSGGRELGKRLADAFGFDYYDKEIIESIAHNQGLDEKYVERSLNNQGWKNVSLTFRRSFSSINNVNNTQINILLEEKRIIEDIAGVGRDCVIVGRNADILLADESPFSIFVCADMQSRIDRCESHAHKDEHFSRREMERNIKKIDKARIQTRELLTDSRWGDCETYDLVVNTSGTEIKSLVPAVKAYIEKYWENR